MASAVDLVFNIIGRDSASPAFKSAGHAASKLDDDVKKAHKSFLGLSTVGKALTAGLAGMGLAGIGTGIAALGKAALTSASDLSEVSTAIEQTFGKESATHLQAWAKTAASSMGQTQTQALDGAKNFGIFGKAAGLSGLELEQFSTGFTSLATDLASFNNTTPAEAIEALGAGLRGESEPLRKYGVLLDDATLKARATTMGIYDGSGALTQQQRILAAHAEILAQTTLQQGDFARTATGFANLQRIASAQTKNLTAEIGAGLLPAATQLTARFVAAMPAIQESVSRAMPSVSTALVGLADKLQEKWPAISDAMQSFGRSFREEWPAIKQTAGTVADALQRVAGYAQTLWDAFRSLPPEAQTTLATLAVLQKTGVISVAFKGVDLARDLFAKVTGMNVTAANVNVNGPGAGGTGTPAGGAGKTGGAASAMTLAGVNVPAVVAAVLAAGTVYSIHQMVTGGAVNKVNETGGNPAFVGGTYASMGNAGSNNNAGSIAAYGAELTKFKGIAELSDAAQRKFSASVDAGSISAENARFRAVAFARAISGTAVAAGMTQPEFDAMSRAITSIPPGASVETVRDAIQRTGTAAGMSQAEIDRMSAAVLGIPGGATLQQLTPAIEAAGINAGLTGAQIKAMSAEIGAIPPGTGADEVTARLTATGQAAGLTETQIQVLIAAVLGIPPTGQTAVSAPGAPESAAQLNSAASAAYSIPPYRSVTVDVNTANAQAGLDALASRISTLKMSASSLGFAAGGAIPSFAPGGRVPVRVSNGEYYASPSKVAAMGGLGVATALNTGMINGPGTSTSDSILAWAQPGGFVFNAAATRRNRRILPRLAGGGPVDATATAAAVTPTVQVVIDGRVLHESLVRYRRTLGGAPLGLS